MLPPASSRIDAQVHRLRSPVVHHHLVVVVIRNVVPRAFGRPGEGVHRRGLGQLKRRSAKGLVLSQLVEEALRKCAAKPSSAEFAIFDGRRRRTRFSDMQYLFCCVCRRASSQDTCWAHITYPTTIAGASAIPPLQCTSTVPPALMACEMNVAVVGKMRMRFWSCEEGRAGSSGKQGGSGPIGRLIKT